MKQKIITHLAKTENCFETCKEKEFGIFDPIEKLPCRLVFGEGEIHFKVINEQEKDIQFLKVDQCLLDDSDGKKCDFIIFDETTFCFCEIKTFGNTSQRSNARKDAYKQLMATFKEFNEIEIPQKIEAIVALNHSKNPYTKYQASPKPKNAGLVLRVLGKKVINKQIELLEGNSKTFGTK